MTELQEKIIELRKQGLGYKKIAKELSRKADDIRYICKRLGYSGVKGKQKSKTQEEWKEIFEKKYPTYTFLHNEGGIEGFNEIQCNRCKTTFRHTGQDMKPSRVKNILCPVCDQKPRKQTLVEIECKICGKLFIGKHHQKYCSDECKRKGRRDIDARTHKLFTLKELYERDKGICHICGGKCDWDDYSFENEIFIPGNNYPTRDHVIPMSQGGEDSWDNLKLAHLVCNSRKGNKL